MTRSADSPAPLPAAAPARPASMRRVATASFIGTTVEYTDWSLYAFAAALVFPQVFFPALGPAGGSIASLATLGAAFVARPVGSIIFGHFGDRLGRKKTLVISLLLMGIGTVLIGLLPSAATIGVAAPILLVVLRVLQGLAVGGEWTGATLLSSENAPSAERGFWAMIPSLGAATGSLLGPAMFLVPSIVFSTEAFLSYGWRIPFLVSVVLVVVGLWVRLSLDETPVFTTQKATGGTAKVPFVEAFRSQPQEIALGAATLMVAFATYYTAATFMASYATSTLGLGRTFVLVAGMIGIVFYGGGMLVGGVLSDRLGRRNVVLGTAAVSIVWSLAMFPLVGVGGGLLYTVTISVTLVLAGLVTGPAGAMVTEMFRTRYRYTAAGATWNLAALLGGAVPPLVSGVLTEAWGGWAFGVFVAVLSAVSLVCGLALKETRGVDLTANPTT